MQIFDFTVNTQNATKEDFDNAVDVLRYADRISGYSTNGGYKKSDAPVFLDDNDDELTANDFQFIIKSIYVFIEKCYEFYPPTSNFSFPYRKFNMQSAIERYLDVYIMMEFMKKYNFTMIPYSTYDKEHTPMLENLSAFVNTSDFLRAFIIAYKDVANLNIDMYKNFGIKIMDSYFSGRFPFVKVDSELYKLKTYKKIFDKYDSITVIFPRYCLNNNKLYQYFDCFETAFDTYFLQHPKQQETFKELFLEYKKQSKKRKSLYYTIEEYRAQIEQKKLIRKNIQKELRDYTERFWGQFQFVFMRSTWQKAIDSYISRENDILRQINEIEEKLITTETKIESLSTFYKTQDFLTSLPDFIPYEDVWNK